MLRFGSHGANVVSLQALLNAIGGSKFSPLVLDGIFGALTHRRVVEFQTAPPKALSGDGIVGPLTIGKLISSIFSQEQGRIPLHLTPARGPIQPFADFAVAPTLPTNLR